jgi:hypothetical protein
MYSVTVRIQQLAFLTDREGHELGANKTTGARAILGFTSTDLYDHTLQRILSYVM